VFIPGTKHKRLNSIFFRHIYCADLCTRVHAIVTASCAVSNRKSRYPLHVSELSVQLVHEPKSISFLGNREGRSVSVIFAQDDLQVYATTHYIIIYILILFNCLFKVSSPQSSFSPSPRLTSSILHLYNFSNRLADSHRHCSRETELRGKTMPLVRSQS